MRLALLVLAACSAPHAPPPPQSPGSDLGAVAVQVDAPEPSQEERLAAIQKAMNELDEGAQACWAAAAVERFDIEGELTAAIDIRGTADAQVSIARDTTHDAKLAACVTALLGKYPWAPPLHGQAIQLPFKFRAPDGQNVIDRALVPWTGQGKLAVAALLDENNSGNGAASLVELAIAAGGSTGMRVADRSELWYFLGPATVGKRAVVAGDMMYVPAKAAREVTAAVDVHALIAIVPGGREGAVRAGALPTPELGAVGGLVGGPVFLPAAAAKVYPRPAGRVVLFAEPATIQAKHVAATVIEFPAGTQVPEHVHAGETELLYMLAGTGTLTVNGVAQAVTATSVVQIPPNTKHAFTATADVRAVQIYTPAGPEQRFKK